ncbi:MAG: GxxExxY protein [Thermoplasmatota archaeon]
MTAPAADGMRHRELPDELNAISRDIVLSAIEVQRALGPGLLERPYRLCLCDELSRRGRHVEQEVSLPVVYKGRFIENAFKMDLVVDRAVVVELKAVDQWHPRHMAQLMTYLRMSGHRLGLIINFNHVPIKDAIHRVAF